MTRVAKKAARPRPFPKGVRRLIDVAIAGRAGRVRVAATVYGPLALHRSLWTNADASSLAVTHVPPGYGAASGIRGPARALAILKSLWPLNWNFTDPKKMPRATNAAARRILLAARS